MVVRANQLGAGGAGGSGSSLVVALRPLRFAGREPSGAGVQAVSGFAARAIDPATEERAFGHDVEAAMRLLWE
jgi:hypothetical protein